jgi:hypothetical protein
MNNVSAADNLIFEFGGLWWLFTNIDYEDCGDYPPHCCELYIFYATDPLSSEWTPHGKNPIFIDSSRARNGGILSRNGCIYRVSQKQGFDRYGKAFSINKISILNKDEYVEECMSTVEATFFEGAQCTHHIHSNNNISVFDYC